MNTATVPSLTPRELLRLLHVKRRLWLVPAVACGALSAAYSLVMPRYWEASQALVVRQETAGVRGATPGKFADLYEMRTLQETILELAKSQEVVANTLKAVDKRRGTGVPEPTAEDIEKFRRRLKMLPPNGGEFGKTEVFYFCVQDTDRQRAMALVGELCRQLDVGLKALRIARAKSLIIELQQEVAAATATLERDTSRLAEFEAQVSGDLGELRMLHSASSGQSDLRQEAVQLDADHRKFETQLQELEQLLALLRSAKDDPQLVLGMPNSLLATQPALRRLKDGLVDAQLATARLAGTRSSVHPRVKAAAEAERQIREDLHRELVSAIGGAEVELRLCQQRLATTEARLKNLDGRLHRLAEQRAEYSNRVAAVDSSRQSLDHARQNLNTALAAEAAARSGSLVTHLDRPETGPYPVGPGRTAITGAGAAAGLMLGLGLVFLQAGVPPQTTPQTVAAMAATPHGATSSNCEADICMQARSQLALAPEPAPAAARVDAAKLPWQMAPGNAGRQVAAGGSRNSATLSPERSSRQGAAPIPQDRPPLAGATTATAATPPAADAAAAWQVVQGARRDPA